MPLDLLCNLVEDALRGLSGPLGVRLRRAWYRKRLSRCGANLRIEPGVHILGTQDIALGDNVWLDRGAVLIAGKPKMTARVVNSSEPTGAMVIGDDCHIGVGCLIQAHGGVVIGDFFTMSAGAKVYSFSNDPAECRKGTTEYGENDPGYRVTPVTIGRNVWIGLDALVIGGRIGDDCFLRPQTIVTGEVPAGCIVDGRIGRLRAPRFSGLTASAVSFD